MMDLLHLYSERWLELMWRIIWQGGVFIAFIFIITKIFRRLSPTIKHLLWMLVIVKFLLMPFVLVPISVLVQPPTVHKPIAEPMIQKPAPSSESEFISEFSTTSPTKELLPIIQGRSPKILIHWHSVLFSVWVSGVVVLLLGIIYRSLRLKRDISTAKVLEDENILNIVEEGSSALNIKTPLVKISGKFGSPLACSILHPTLIFPEHIIHRLNQSELRAIINHELAHIKRLDILTNWLQIVTQVFYFFNPLIWYVNRQIRLEREQACDDWVLQMGKEERKTYADALLKIVEICSKQKGFALGIVGVSEPFTLMARRLKMIMDKGRKVSTRLSVGAIIGLVVIGLVGIPAYAKKEVSAPSSRALRHYRDGWLKYLGKPTEKPDREKKAAEKAVIAFQKAIEIDPENVIFRQSLAFAFEKQGRVAEAEEQYRKVMELNPQDGFPHYALARFYERNKSSEDKVIDEIRIAIQKNSDEALFRYHLAHLLYLKAGEYGDGGREYSITDEKLAEKAFAEIQAGNSKVQFTQYMAPYPKDFSSKLDYIRVIGLWASELLPDLAIARSLSRENIALGKLYEKQDNVKKAVETYQAILIMGKRIAEQRPLAMIKMLVGMAIDSMAFGAFEELYSAQGMQDKVQWVQKGKEKLEEIQKLIKEEVAEMSKHQTSFWTKEEKKLKQNRGEELFFLESPFIREMLEIWPTIASFKFLKANHFLKVDASKISITVFPIIMSEKPSKKVSEVIALMLEKAGLKEIDVSEEVFLPSAEDDIWQISESFSTFIRKKSMDTDYALFGEYVGTPQTGVKEVRCIVVDREGKRVWVDRQTPEDDDFKRIDPKNPMLCSVILVERLRTRLGLSDPLREDKPEGKWATHWDKESGIPPDSELSAMKERRTIMRENFKNAKMLIFPVLVNEEVSKENAVNLAELLNEKKICQADVAPEYPLLKSEPSSNELKVLWDLARKFRSYVKENKIEADYAFYGQYFIDINPKGKECVGAVHFIVCDRYGEWVIVGLQNEYQPDFKSISPKTALDCGRLVVKRLEGYLNEEK